MIYFFKAIKKILSAKYKTSTQPESDTPAGDYDGYDLATQCIDIESLINDDVTFSIQHAVCKVDGKLQVVILAQSLIDSSDRCARYFTSKTGDMNENSQYAGAAKIYTFMRDTFVQAVKTWEQKE